MKNAQVWFSNFPYAKTTPRLASGLEKNEAQGAAGNEVSWPHDMHPPPRPKLFLVLRTLRRAREKNLQILELKQIDEREIDDDMDWNFNTNHKKI